jgi:hypothetical protein
MNDLSVEPASNGSSPAPNPDGSATSPVATPAFDSAEYSSSDHQDPQ